jgi:GDP-4-dehydro-6-deoxy-D-mannose reductase
VRVVVTGAEGFVGSHLIPLLLARGHHVFGTFLEQHPDIPGTTWIQTDLVAHHSVQSLLDEARPEGIIHLAAISHVPDVEADPGRAFSANVTGLVHLLRLSEGTDPIVVVVSTGEVYGCVPTERLPIRESEPVVPLNLYGVTKACSEQVAWYFHRAKGVRATVVRPFSQMGPGQADTFVCSSFARQIARIMRGKASPAVRVGNLGVRRDFMDVRDVVRAYASMVERYAGPGPFNVCQGKSVTIGEILNLLIEAAGIPVEVRVDSARVRTTDIEDMVGDSSVFRKTTGWRPEFTLGQSLEDTLRFWIAVEGGP